MSDEAARHAIRTDFSTSMLVEAGAGSGKTTLIVDRMLGLIQSGAAIDGIAAVTFTRKAATELRERFEEALEARLLEVSAQDAARRLLERAHRDRQRMFIGTIHAFCSRILREHAIQAALPPDFEELDELGTKLQRERYWRQFVEQLEAEEDPILAALDDAAISLDDLTPAFADFELYRDTRFDADVIPRPPHGALRDRLLELIADTRLIEERAAGARCGIFDVMQTLARMARLTNQWASAADFARDARRLPFDAESSFIRITLFGKSAAEKQPMQQLRTEYLQFAAQLEQWTQQWNAFAYPTVIALLRRASDSARAKRQQQGRLDFDDLLLECARVLREDPDLRATVSRRWEHLLIDEFQDTDPVQAEVCLLIASSTQSLDRGDWRRAIPDAGRLFVVGDPKQSIYRFRRADIATYEFVKERIAITGQVHLLTSNYRSAAAIADLVNAHFPRAFEPPTRTDASADPFAADSPRLARNSAQDVIQARFAEMIPKGEVTTRTDGIVSRYVVGPPAFDFAFRHTAEEDARVLASLIAERLASGEQKASDFLVLTSQRPRLQRYAREFARRGIPVEVTGAFTDADDLLDELLVILRAIADPTNAVEVIAALEGISCGADLEQLYLARERWDISRPPVREHGIVSDGLRRLHAWWRASQTMPTASLIEMIVDDLMLLPLLAGSDLGEERAGLLLHLIGKVREATGNEAHLHYALELIDQLLAEENTALPLRPGRENAVRLMNLHRAKGLEANVVVLAAPVADGVREKKLLAWRSPEGEMHAALRIMSGESVLAAPLDWSELAEADNEREAAERVRLLYVAVTRAKEELIVAQRRPYTSSGGARGDEGPWAPLRDVLALSTLLEPQVTPYPERPVITDGSAVDQSLEEIAATRLRATQPRVMQQRITEAAKQDATDAESDGKAIAGVRAATPGLKAGLSMGRAMHTVLDGALRGRRGAVLDRYIDAVGWQEWAHESEEHRAELIAHLRTLVAHAIESAGFLSLAQYDVQPELPVAYTVGEEGFTELREGVLDALGMGDRDGLLVDWKTAESESRFRTLRPAYRAQAEAYAEAVARRSGSVKPKVVVQPVSSVPQMDMFQS